MSHEDPTTLAVRDAVKGDQGAQARLFERFAPALLATARYRVRGELAHFVDAEDLVQETWIKTLPRFGDLRERDGRLTPVLLQFLRTTMVHLHQGWLRRLLRGELVELRESQIGASSTGVVGRVVRDEAGRQLLAALEQLDDQDREVVILRGLEQCPNHEVALLLGIAANTVAKRYGRALDRLRMLVPGSLLEDL